MFDKKFLGMKIRELRASKKVNQTVIATLLGVTKTQISDIENGKASTTIEKLVQLADYFGVSLDYLTGRTDNPNSHKA
jgi:transcriptional regulator with XRE-family HTH domain